MIKENPVAKTTEEYHIINSIQAIDEIGVSLGKKLPPASPQLQIAITIPAKNEENYIFRTLNALKDQITKDGIFVDKSLYEVIVLCHECNDSTFSICSRFSKIHPEFHLHVLELDAAVVNNVGAARRVLMNIAADRLTAPNGLIATTDADTVAQLDWVQHLLNFSDLEVDMVCGLIKVDAHNLTGSAKKTLMAKQRYWVLRTKLEARLFPNPNDPWPKHAHNSGPNLAVKKHCYKTIGGMPPLGFLEDIALYDAVASHGFVIRHSNDCVVTTSCRLNARAPWGFASELRDWGEDSEVTYKVEGLEKLLYKFGVFKKIATYYEYPSQKILKTISERSFIDLEILLKLYRSSPCAQAMVVRVDRNLDTNKLWNMAYPNKEVATSLGELKGYFENYR